MNAFTNYLDKLGSNFLVASMVPSLALVIACLLVFDPILNAGAAFRDPQSTYGLVSFGLVVFVFTVIIGYTLTALNTFILKMFEGYIIPFPLRFVYSLRKRSHWRKASDIRERREQLRNEIEELQNQVDQRPDLFDELERKLGEYYGIASNYQLSYPEDPNDILPTRFGNTLKAAENYPGERFGLDGVLFWPRLVHVIPSEYKMGIDAVRNELSFLVNMSILSFLFAGLSLVAIFYTMGTANVGVGGAASFINFAFQITPYFVAMMGGIVVSVFFYNASLFSVGSFGMVIRASFDLFRFELLKKMGLERPKNTAEEFDTWYQLNDLIALGNQSVTFTSLTYREKE